jgi:NitT/TauT family transport system substrate-binding protein
MVVRHGDYTAASMARRVTSRLSARIASSIKTIADLKGRHIGVSTFGTTDYPVGKDLLRLAGFDPEKDVTWVAVGEDVTAGLALKTDRVDALVYFDTGFGEIEAAGIPLRYLPLPRNGPRVGGNYVAALPSMLSQHRSWAVRLARGIVKGEVFIQENPDAAAYVFIRMFPEAAPKGQSLQDQIKSISIPIRKRLPRYSNYDRSISSMAISMPRSGRTRLHLAVSTAK